MEDEVCKKYNINIFNDFSRNHRVDSRIFLPIIALDSKIPKENNPKVSNGSILERTAQNCVIRKPFGQ